MERGGRGAPTSGKICVEAGRAGRALLGSGAMPLARRRSLSSGDRSEEAPRLREDPGLVGPNVRRKKDMIAIRDGDFLRELALIIYCYRDAAESSCHRLIH